MSKNIALITGVTGQDGSYLSEFLLAKGYEVHGIIRRSSVDYRERIAHLEGVPNFHLHYADMIDSIGICVPGLCRHYYDNNFWSKKIENTNDEITLRFLEEHLVMVPMTPRLPGCSVVEGKDITPAKVKALADAAEACWNAILKKDLEAFAAANRASFDAQTAMSPGMVAPTYINHPEQDNSYIADTIAHYSAMDDVLAWKMPGAGGGGYLALVVKDAKTS